jgi:hypothetical protein
MLTEEGWRDFLLTLSAFIDWYFVLCLSKSNFIDPMVENESGFNVVLAKITFSNH